VFDSEALEDYINEPYLILDDEYFEHCKAVLHSIIGDIYFDMKFVIMDAISPYHEYVKSFPDYQEVLYVIKKELYIIKNYKYGGLVVYDMIKDTEEVKVWMDEMEKILERHLVIMVDW